MYYTAASMDPLHMLATALLPSEHLHMYCSNLYANMQVFERIVGFDVQA